MSSTPERRLTPPNGEDLISGLSDLSRLPTHGYVSNKSAKRGPTLLEAAGKDEKPEKKPSVTPTPTPSRASSSSESYNQTGIYDVNDVIERAGFGPYQMKAIMVIGIMSFADAAEIWLATLIIKNLQCEWNLNSVQKAMIPAIVYAFYAVGSITSGRLADKFGRFWVLLINSYILVVSAVCSALSPSYQLFVICRGLTGFCIGGNYSCSIVYIQEIIPTRFRSLNIFIFEIIFAGGCVFECVLAFFVMHLDNGWRYQVFFTAIPVMIMLIFMHFMDESPRFLVINNQREAAQKVVEKIHRENQVEPLKGDLFVQDERSGGFPDIWARPHTCGSIQITIHFVCNMFLYFGVFMLIPEMMSGNYCSLDMFFQSTKVDENSCTVYSDAEYLFLIVIILAGLPGMVAGAWIADCVGRKPGMITSIYAGAIFTGLLGLCINNYITYIELFCCVFFYTAYNQILWIYTPEFYATYMRGTAIGVQNGIGKLGAAGGTFLTTYLVSMKVEYAIYCFIAVQLVACATVLFMRKETQGQVLQDRRATEESPIVSGDAYVTNYGTE